MMQRQRRKHESVESSPFPAKQTNDLAAGPGMSRPTPPAVPRTNSKIKQSRKRGVYLMLLGIPALLCIFVLYSTTLFHGGDEFVATHGEYRNSIAKIPSSQTGDKQPQRDLVGDEVGKLSGGYEYHIVFSTGCSLYQDWQSYVFFYQAMVSQQPGTITRIVSGCDSETEEAEMRKIFDDQIRPMAPDRFKLHITPDFSKLPNGKSFVYFNKPFGMKHWLENALGFPSKPENEDSIVILVDPDQLILRPFRNNDFSNTDWAFIRKGEKPYTKIEHGKPMGQLYGFGLQWKDKINMTAIVPHSPVDKLTRKEAQAGFIVGPPYKMFAYCLGAAHAELAHQTARSFMVSDAFTGNMEGWRYIDNLPKDKVCGGYTEEQVPNVLHFCQRYGMGKYFFGKRKLPKNFLTCESPLLREPPTDLLEKYKFAIFPGHNKKTWSAEMAQRNAFVVCVMLPVLNAAATHFKDAHCKGNDATNYEKSLIFFDNIEISDKELAMK